VPRLIDSLAARVFNYLADAALNANHVSGSAFDILYDLVTGNPGAAPAANSYLDRIKATSKLVDAALDGTEASNSIGRATRQMFLEAAAAAPVSNSALDRVILAAGGAHPTAIGTLSEESVGVSLAACAAIAPVSNAVNADRIHYIPIVVRKAVTVVECWAFNGATAAGSASMSVYDAAGARLVAEVTQAQAGTNTVQAFNIADTSVGPGLIYVAWKNNNASGTIVTIAHTGPNAGQLSRFSGVLEQDYATAGLPATATFATWTWGVIPIIGISTRAL
jgi:hypothetical protein